MLISTAVEEESDPLDDEPVSRLDALVARSGRSWRPCRT